MSDTILSGDVTVHYLDENRQKRLEWTGAASGTRTVNELYAALQDWFDESTQMDDGIPMSAETPVEYTIGIIDAGDTEPWYMSYELMEHLYGGAVRTASWTRVTSSNAGIVVVPVTAAGNTIVKADIGLDISGATTGNGTLLEVIEAPFGGTLDYLVIRPNTSAAGDDFTTASQTITCNAHTGAQSGAVSFTGEQIWANLYSLGTIEADTHIYVYQGAAADDATRTRVVSLFDSTQDWWGDGHLNRCFFTKDFTSTGIPVIDGGYFTVLARKYTTLYAAFEVATSLTSGGQNAVPLQTGGDLDNTTGYRQVTLGTSAGNWNAGNEILGATSGARGIITGTSGTNPSITLQYYLIDDPLTDFNGSEAINNQDDTGTSASSGSPSNFGPADATWFSGSGVPTTTFGNTTFDVDDDGTPEWYGITIDCNQNPLTEVYEWLKYITRRGATGTTNTDGIPGELYRGGEVYLRYTGTVTGTIAEGSNVSQETSLATGVVISHDTTNKVLLLRSVRGTWFTNASTATLTDADTGGTVEIDAEAVTFAPIDARPFGSFAGGTFFGARGVLLSDWASADENSFQLVPVNGGTKTRPQAISITVSNLIGTAESVNNADSVAVFRLASGVINKTEFSAAGGEVAGDATLVVDGSIPADVPGKTTGGVLRIRDNSDNNKGYRLRFASWTGSTFTLANTVGTATAGTDPTTLIDSGASFGTTARRGDLVWNSTRTAYAYVVTVDSATQLTLDRAIASQTSGDTYELNALPIAIDTLDDVYVPFIDRKATAGSESVSVVYVSPISFRVVVRNNKTVAGPPSAPIKPFSTDGSTSGTDVSVPAIRTTDTIT